jgi:uncharacterized protein with NRDE domain
MCTVSYIPPRQEEGFILTSSRDERAYRETIPPACYLDGEISLCYPKDSKAGGSWIAINNQGRLCCLLNGGFEAHVKKSTYRKSRGLVLLGVCAYLGKAEDYFSKEDLSDIEPFTIITIDQSDRKISDFREFVWDGNKKYFKILNINQTYMWSSVTLYSPENRTQRKQWFSDFLNSNALNMSAEKVLTFHSAKHTDDKANNLLMAREGELRTVSITQILQEKTGSRMIYKDLIKNFQTETVLWNQKNIPVLR